MDIEKIFFAFIVEDFGDVKELYKTDPHKAFELFKQKLKEIDENSKDPNSFRGAKGMKISNV
ncbi:MAG: hypothetical protein ABGX26_02685 [Nautiliaceae bacterium]